MCLNFVRVLEISTLTGSQIMEMAYIYLAWHEEIEQSTAIASRTPIAKTTRIDLDRASTLPAIKKSEECHKSKALNQDPDSTTHAYPSYFYF